MSSAFSAKKLKTFDIEHQDASVDIWDKGAPTRDFIFVKDVVEATKLGLKILSNYKTYDVGTGESFPIIEIAEKSKVKLQNFMQEFLSEINISNN